MRRYYRTEIPESSIASNRLDASRARLSRQGVLGGEGRVERVSGEAADVRLDVDYRGKYAERLARELREALSSDDIEAAAFAVDGTATQPSDSYYTAELVDDQPAMPQAAGAVSVGANLTEVGTRKEQTLTVDTAPSQPSPGHPFGNDTDALIGIPGDARRVRIVDSTSEPTKSDRPVPVATVEATHGPIDLFDATAESINEPVYLYDLAYELQGDVDPGVWDTYGSADQLDQDGVVAWGRVFSTSHDFGAGAIVLEKGLLRLTIDEPTNADATAALEAETYDAGTDSWSAVDLPSYADGDLATDWQPADVDLTHVGQARIEAQVEFEAVAGTNAGDVYAADVQLDRGRDRAFITETSDGELPPDLEALLTPIAATSVVDPGVEQGLVAREEVRA